MKRGRNLKAEDESDDESSIRTLGSNKKVRKSAGDTAPKQEEAPKMKLEQQDEQGSDVV